MILPFFNRRGGLILGKLESIYRFFFSANFIMDILQYTHALVIIKSDFLYSLTISLYVSVRSSRYEARLKFGEHERCVASWVLSKLPKCFISRWTHRWRMNQLFYNIFNPMGDFFFRDLFADVMSVHNRNIKHARAIQFD